MPPADVVVADFVRRRYAMHLKRWITGLTLLPFLIYIIFKGGLLFTAFIGLLALLGFWEYLRVVFNDSRGAIGNPVVWIAYPLVPTILTAAHFHAPVLIFHLIMLLFLVCACLSVFLYGRDGLIYESAQKILIGIIYIPGLFSYLILIRDGRELDGALWILFILVVVFAGDIGALYAGTFWGRHKLSPTVSPNKTIEGSLGGLAANILLGSIFKMVVFPELNWGVCLLFFISLGAMGQMGDLFESGLKRVAGIKDSGGLLPGHGGILDRADATMFAAPVAYLFKVYIF